MKKQRESNKTPKHTKQPHKIYQNISNEERIKLIKMVCMVKF